MVKNTIGGKGAKRGKRRSKNPNLSVDVSTGIDHYAQVQKRLGGNRLQVLLDDGQEVQAVIPGKFFKKLWFNSGDFIHVRCENSNFYDVIQKLLDPTEQQHAATALGKKLDDGEHNIFRPDVQEDDEEDEFDIDNIDNIADGMEDSDDVEDDDKTQNSGSGFGSKSGYNKDKVSRNERKAQMLRTVTKQSVCVDKFQRKVNEKERDINRRATTERDFSQMPESIIKSDEASSDEESSDEALSESNNEQNKDVDIDAI